MHVAIRNPYLPVLKLCRMAFFTQWLRQSRFASVIFTSNYSTSAIMVGVLFMSSPVTKRKREMNYATIGKSCAK